MISEEWDRFGNWHRLFDRLCRLRGYSENAQLASALCRELSRSSERDFQAAEKNLRNWRRGRRIPLRRNAAILARLLDVEADPALKRRWDRTYRALQDGEAGDALGSPSPKAPVADRIAPPQRTLLLWAALPAGLLAVTGLQGLAASGDASMDTATLPTVAYNARAFLSVGTEKLIHGVAEGCDGPPSDWADMAAYLSESATGAFSDGGLATKMMNGCGKEMVVRAVKFIAIRPGVEELEVLGAYFKIEVTPSSIDPGRGP
ncbi:hypothetical protein AB3G45_00610 [Shinella sp. S4-D37]|uniref:hypothetical protein n=1 Tax=Shinella sp. S4-D37 TaxID=3161999 RepID=UPI003467DE5F